MNIVLKIGETDIALGRFGCTYSLLKIKSLGTQSKKTELTYNNDWPR